MTDGSATTPPAEVATDADVRVCRTALKLIKKQGGMLKSAAAEGGYFLSRAQALELGTVIPGMVELGPSGQLSVDVSTLYQQYQSVLGRDFVSPDTATAMLGSLDAISQDCKELDVS